MPRYFFDLVEGQERSWDAMGKDLPSCSEARREAHLAVAGIARHALAKGRCETFKCHVRDESNRLIYRATLSTTGHWL